MAVIAAGSSVAQALSSWRATSPTSCCTTAPQRRLPTNSMHTSGAAVFGADDVAPSCGHVGCGSNGTSTGGTRVVGGAVGAAGGGRGGGGGGGVGGFLGRGPAG